jgi:hypothetical protein
MYGYLMVVFSIVILVWAVWAMYSAFNFQQQGNMESFYFYAVAGSVAIVLAVSSIMQMRRRMVLQSMVTKVLSVVLCANCGFKVVRGFGEGDFVYKEVGKCQQCSGPMRVESIYAEEPPRKRPI